MKKKLSILKHGSILLIVLSLGACNKRENNDSIFPKGELAPSENFTGNAWNNPFVANDTVYNIVAGKVYFEPGARTNWHSHPSGQLLLIIEGEGFHQIKGEPKQALKKGDVVKCPPNVIHWHGASAATGMSHIYIVPNTEKGIVNWMEQVSNQEYESNY